MAHPVGMIASKHAKRSGIESLVNTTSRTIAATSPKDVTPCVNLMTSWNLADFLRLRVNTYIL